MKKLLLVAGLLFVSIAPIAVQAQDDLYYLEIQGEDTTINRELYQKYLNEHPFENRPRMTKEDWKKIPKADRPDLAWEQEFLRTMDPKTGRPMTERIFPILAQLQGGPAQFGLAPGGSSTNQWTERGPNNVGGRTRALLFDPNDATNKKVWAGGVTGGLWVNNDITSSTSTWTAVNDFWANIAVTCIAYDPNNKSTMYVGTGEGWGTGASRGAGIWKSTNGGTSWTQLSSTTAYYYVNDIVVRDEGSSTSAVYAAVNRMAYKGQFHGSQGLFRSTNGGTSWTQVLPNAGTQPHAPADIEIGADDRIWIGTRSNSSGIGGGKVMYSDNGTTWLTAFTHPGSARRVEISCAPSDSATIFGIVEKSGVVEDIIKSSDHGFTWLRSSTSTNLTEPNDADNGIPATDFSRNQAWYDLISVINPSDEDDIIVGGIDLFRSTDGGKNWTQISKWSNNANLNTLNCPLVHADQHQAVYRPGTTKELIFGNDGGVYYCSDVTTAATTSTVISSRNSGYNVTQFYAGAIHPSSGSNIMLAGAQDNGTQRYSTAGMNSTTRPIGGDGAFCHIDQTNGQYQAGSYVYNSLYRSTNSGSSFSRFVNDLSTGRFINPSDYDDVQNILYTCKTNTEIYRFSNFAGGTISTSTLTVTGMGAKATAMTVSPHTTTSTTIFIGNSSGQIYKMTNANGTPTTTDLDPLNVLPGTSISCIEVGATENELIVTYFNYGINSVWYTNNGGTSWVSKEGLLPDMPVRWALFNPKNRKEVILATEVGVWATTDITATTPTWVASNMGLANVRVDMLQYRSSDSLVMATTHGRGVFTGRFMTPTSGVSKPVASFTTNKDTICAGDSITFTSTSTNNPTALDWTFTGGSPGTAGVVTPIVTYANAGSFDVKLKATNAGGSDSITVVNRITVHPIPAASVPNPGPLCSNGNTITLSGGTPTGGVYKINGFTSTTFDPVAAGVGNYTLEYTVTDANGCVGTDVKTIVVNAHPTVTASNLPAQCQNNPPFALSNGSPSGGVYSGPGVSGGNFDASAAGVGTHTLQYKMTNSNQCSDSTNFTVMVTAGPTVTFATLGPFCSGDPSQTLTQGSPSGGTYSGPGVAGGSFDPTTAGIGTHVLKYVFTDANGCSDSATTSVVVSNGVSVTLSPFTNQCSNNPSFILTGGSPNGGTYSGPGVSGGIFDPAVAGAGTHTITYTHPLGCGGGSATQTIQVDSVPNLTLTNDTFVCISESVQLMASGATTYSWTPGGSLSSSTIANPIASPSVTTVYIVTASYGNPCSVEDSVEVEVRQLPNVSAGPDTSACQGTPFQLQATGAVNYSWVPPVGLSSTTISNPVATITTSQTYIVTGTDAFGCTNSDVINLQVLNSPNVNLTVPDSTCEETPPITLNGGTPTGGLYTGSGVVNGVFDPKIAGQGSHSIYYTFTGTNGCTAADTQTIIVTGPPVVTWVQTGPFCSGAAPIPLQATPSGGSFSGNGVSNGSFDPTTAGEGTHVLTYSVTDGNGCSSTSDQSVIVFPDSPIDSIQGFFHVVQNQSYNYRVNPINGAAYTWTVVSGNIQQTQSNSTAVKWGAGPTGEIEVVQVTANGCRDTTREIVYISILGTEEFELAGNRVYVYPNPATDEVKIRFENTYQLGEIEAYLYNASGQELHHSSREYLNAGEEWLLETVNLENGIYFLHLVSGGNRIQAPVMIQR